MARPRTASTILDARGAFKKDPQRARKKEPEGKSAFPKKAPNHLTKKQKACWDEIVSIAPAGVLTGSDTIAVEVVAVLLEEFRALNGKLDTTRITRLTSEMAKIGLTPSARAGLQVDKSKENEFDDL